jgi:hypothetical protein
MTERVTAYSLRTVISEMLRDYYKDYEIEAACTGFGMPEVDGAWTYNSKRVYVSNRLTGVQLPQMREIAQRILDEHDDERLAELMHGVGVTGVDGDMRNLIFAADGPKPRIVLSDAINNVIDIKEGADRVLVYDRPLAPTGLTWGELVSWWKDAGRANPNEAKPGHTLYRRLMQSLDSDAERVLFRAYGSATARSALLSGRR